MKSDTSFWRRLGDMFRGNHADDSDRGGEAGQLRRAPSNQELRENYKRVTDLMDSLEQHFTRQDDRAAHLIQAVDRVGNVLEQIANEQAEQRASLQTLARQVDGADSMLGQLNGSLRRLPDALRTQAEAVQAISHQVEIAQEADHRVAHALLELGQSVDTLGTSSTTQAEILRDIGQRGADQQRWLENVSQQGRKLVLVLVIALVLALLVAAGTITYALMSVGGGA